MVLKICDEMEKGASLFGFFKLQCSEYIKLTLIPNLERKREESLVQEFI
jgi:hypothetical protein